MTTADRPSVTDSARAKRTTGKCPSCGYRYPLRKDGRLVLHQIAYNTPCSGSGVEPEVERVSDEPAGRAETTVEDAARLVRQYVDVPFSTALILVHALVDVGMLIMARPTETEWAVCREPSTEVHPCRDEEQARHWVNGTDHGTVIRREVTAWEVARPTVTATTDRRSAGR